MRLAWFVPHGQWRSGGGGRGYEIGHLLGGPCPPGPDYVGHWGSGMTFREDNKRDRMCTQYVCIFSGDFRVNANIQYCSHFQNEQTINTKSMWRVPDLYLLLQWAASPDSSSVTYLSPQVDCRVDGLEVTCLLRPSEAPVRLIESVALRLTEGGGDTGSAPQRWQHPRYRRQRCLLKKKEIVIVMGSRWMYLCLIPT